MPRLGLFGGSNFTGLGLGTIDAPFGEALYTTPGTYSWVAPAGVTSVSAVAVGGGGIGGQANSAGGGGALAYRNNITVVPGTAYTIVVGAGSQYSNPDFSGGGPIIWNGGDSTAFGMIAGGGMGGQFGGAGGNASGTIDGGGSGGNGGTNPGYPNSGAGGAGGYTESGDSGQPGSVVGDTYTGGEGGNAGNYPIAGGAGTGALNFYGGNGGGIGLYGIGSGAVAGSNGGVLGNRIGGIYGGGAASSGAGPTTIEVNSGGGGAVRIIWGFGRGFPNAAGPTPPAWTVYNINTAIPGWGTDSVNDINWNGSQFLIVGNNGKVATSPNGITWTYRPNLSTTAWGNDPVYAIAWDGSQYLIGGGSGQGTTAGPPSLATSPDGITWTVQSLATITGESWNTGPVYAILHDGSRFIITGGDSFNSHIATGVQGTESSTFTVTNSGASAYTIDSASNPALTLQRGGTYTFNVSATGHPFWIKTAQTTGTGSAYNTGVTNNGADSGTITFTVPNDAPSTLYYICQFHGAMTGTINIVTNPNGITWTGLPTPMGNAWGLTIAWNNNPETPIYFIGGFVGYSAQSSDAVTWIAEDTFRVDATNTGYTAETAVYSSASQSFIVGSTGGLLAIASQSPPGLPLDFNYLGSLVNESTWQSQNVERIIQFNNSLIAVGGGGKISVSTNGGTTWGPSNSLRDSSWAGSDSITAIATNGRRFVVGGISGNGFHLAVSKNLFI
jgi:hypothetical protein